jgi:hypothetical protein
VGTTTAVHPDNSDSTVHGRETEGLLSENCLAGHLAEAGPKNRCFFNWREFFPPKFIFAGKSVLGVSECVETFLTHAEGPILSERSCFIKFWTCTCITQGNTLNARVICKPIVCCTC